MTQLVLKNGQVVYHDGQKKEDILIRGGKISSVGRISSSNKNIKIIDCDHKLIFPGIIDAHTHMGIPIKSGVSADNFKTGSRSALNGGVTTIIDFTVLKQNQSLVDSIKERRKLAEESLIEVALHCNITRSNTDILKEIPKIISMGINSFKVFTTYREAGMRLNYKEIEEIAKIINDNDGLLMVHAEDNEIIENSFFPLFTKKLTHPKYHAIARPAEAEKIAIEKIANISEKTGCKIYIVHLNTSAGLQVAQQCKNMLIETCPQYLLLDDSVYNRVDGQMFVTSPPLRNQHDCMQLWEGVMNGAVDVIATDHCPFMLKDRPYGLLFQDIPNGIGGVETLFPIMLYQFIRRGINLSRLVELISTNPAKIFNLYPCKGNISPGANADLVIVDPNNISKDWTNKLVSVTDWNAFTEFPAIFPEKVIVGGKIIN